MGEHFIQALALAYVAGLLTIPALVIVFILVTDDTPSEHHQREGSSNG